MVGVVLVFLLLLTRLSADAVRSDETLERASDRAAVRSQARTASLAGGGTATQPTEAVGPPDVETGPLTTVHVTDPEPTPEWADTAAEWDVRIEYSRAALAGGSVVERVAGSLGGTERAGGGALSTRALLANVAGSQLLFAGLLVGVIWWAGVPADALGAGVSSQGVTLGIGVGVGLWGLSELGGRVARRAGVDPATGLRELLSPDTRGEWALLLTVVLPIVAGFEELLFRGVLIGAMSAGFPIPVWLAVVGSSVAFAAGHSAQGRLGITVTGLLGLLLGTVFALTGELLVVVVAHYVVNAAEFLVHETD